jgi:nucleoporin NDC1
MATVKAIDDRVVGGEDATNANAPVQEVKVQVESLPRISTPLKSDNILVGKSPPPAKFSERAVNYIGDRARAYGQAPPSENTSPTRLRAWGYVKEACDKMLTPEQQERITPTGISALFQEQILGFLQTPAGTVFRQAFPGRLRAAVLGSPTSALHPTLHAIDGLVNLAVASLREDSYGTAYKDIPHIIRKFATTVRGVEGLVQSMPIHWTDVKFQENGGQGRKDEEVEILLAHLKAGLGTLLESFAGYALDMGITQAEMKEAKRLAGLN